MSSDTAAAPAGPSGTFAGGRETGSPRRLPPGPLRPPFPAQALQLWLVCLERVPDGATALLEEAELRRADEILPPARRRQWLAARAALRLLLARYTGTAPGSLRLRADGAGRSRAELDGAPAFSLAHSGTLALFAFSDTDRLGVDVERAGRGRRLLGATVSARLLGAERAGRLASLDSDTAADQLLRAWVRREALLKCREPAAWVAEPALGGGVRAAVARAGEPVEIRCWELDLAGPPRGQLIA